MDIIGYLKKQLLERLWNGSYKSDECWLFKSVSSTGYSDLLVGGRIHGVHRISASLYLGLDLDDSSLQVNHKIECPNRNCWNPEHLYLGTQAQNMADLKGRPCRLCGGPRKGVFVSQRDSKVKTYCITCTRARHARVRLRKGIKPRNKRI